MFTRYKYIIENIKDVVWEMTKDFVFTFVSPNVKEMTGYDAGDLIGHKMPEFLVKCQEISLSISPCRVFKNE